MNDRQQRRVAGRRGLEELQRPVGAVRDDREVERLVDVDRAIAVQVRREGGQRRDPARVRSRGNATATFERRRVEDRQAGRSDCHDPVAECGRLIDSIRACRGIALPDGGARIRRVGRHCRTDLH